jgi:hypothetical protein
MTMSGVAAARAVIASVLVAIVAIALPADAAGGLTAHIVLPSTTMAAGTTMYGTLVIDNAGRPVAMTGCGVDAVLSNGAITQQFMCDLVLRGPIPSGESRWEIELDASYTACGGRGGDRPRCEADGYPPPLPAGSYRVVIIGVEVVSTPPVAVRLTA